MTPSGRLYLARVCGTPLLLLLLGLLLALPPEAQVRQQENGGCGGGPAEPWSSPRASLNSGLPGVGLSPSAARTAHQHPQKHFTQDTLKPAAHLVGIETSDPQVFDPHPQWLFLGDPSTQNSLRWRANTDRAFLRHGFSLSNNSLLVPTSGLYFVYSQVVFSGEGCFPKATPTPLYLAHEVQLFSSQYPFHVPLLSAQKSVCPGPQGPWVHSVYQGAVFLLTQGDQLSTHTDGISHLLLSPSSVFFGAFAL
ncbi:hypothetical protein HPG69_012709 [Diceros bicornis minor]|uniref:Lymphotoxin-alpha n=1 Tax=Diceros bicornis minor TaxID=77932 RepID=A0A7J7EIT0_DICBM|nr:hypothetical protein HPG69_012709 [Diceros bicornis minor]